MAILQPLAVRNYRLLWIGESISVLGDQFYLVALPWLTLQLSGSSLALGTVLMTAAIPRGALVLLGGAITDRLPPRDLMLGSNALRALVVGVLAGLILSHHAQLWHLYVLAFLFGTVDAVFFPASAAMVPLLLDEDRLAGGNALFQISQQMGGLLGPVVAGVLIASLSATTGNGTAFLVDALSFVVAALGLSLIRGTRARRTQAEGEDGSSEGLFASIGAGIRYAWADPVLRTLLLVSLALNFSINGPAVVGLPLLAHNRFPQGAVAFGMMIAAESVGGLAGTLLAGSIEKPPRKGLLIIGLAFLMGIGILLIGLSPNVFVAIPMLVAIGLGAGFLNVLAITWLQTRTDEAMLGRLFAMFTLTGVILEPVGVAGAGALAAVNLTLLFATAAALLVLAGLGTAASKTMRSFE